MATRLVRYVGEHDAMDIPAIGVVAERGAEVEVDSEIAKELLARGDWEAVTSRKKGGS